MFSALGNQLAVVIGVTFPADDKDVSTVEPHTTVLLHHGQRHQLDVGQLGTKGRQLLAEDVPKIEDKEDKMIIQRCAGWQGKRLSSRTWPDLAKNKLNKHFSRFHSDKDT